MNAQPNVGCQAFAEARDSRQPLSLSCSRFVGRYAVKYGKTVPFTLRPWLPQFFFFSDLRSASFACDSAGKSFCPCTNSN